MKILNRHVYLILSKKEIDPEKIRLLKDGRGHIGKNPIRKKKEEKNCDTVSVV